MKNIWTCPPIPIELKMIYLEHHNKDCQTIVENFNNPLECANFIFDFFGFDRNVKSIISMIDYIKSLNDGKWYQDEDLGISMMVWNTAKISFETS